MGTAPDSNDQLRPERFWPSLAAALDAIPATERTPPADARIGAVLVLLEDTLDGPSVVLTRRRRDMRAHPGQVSFAGGRVDPGESFVEAALREATEEIGLDPASVEIVGVAGTFYIPPSRFWVVPVVARWARPHPLRENPWEVDAVLHTPLRQLLDPERWRHAPLSLQGSSWAWQLRDDILWGATAFAMATLLDIAIPRWHAGTRPEELGNDRAVRPWESTPPVARRARLDGDLPEWAQDSVTHVTSTHVRAIRRWLAERGVGTPAMAEHAGRAVAHAVRRLTDARLDEVSVTVLAGPSTNGAVGLAAARLLASAGALVDVRVLGVPRLPRQLLALRDAGITVRSLDVEEAASGAPPGDVVVDAVLGIGARPPLHGVPQAVAVWLRRFATPVVAVEVPSGVSADDGLRGPCITADVTIALGLPVVATRQRIVHAYLGDLYLADVGVPPGAWSAVGIADAPVFADGPLVRLTSTQHGSDAATPDQGETVRGRAPESTAGTERDE